MKSPGHLCSTPIATSAAYPKSAPATPAASAIPSADSVEPSPSSPVGGNPPAPEQPLTPYADDLAHFIVEAVGNKGLSFSAAADELGITFASLCRWRLERRDFDFRLLAARSGYRSSRLRLLQDATTRDGRPDWRAAAWELEHAYPADYSLDPKRRAAFEAARQAEAREWERLQFEYQRSDAQPTRRTDTAPPSEKLQNPSPVPEADHLAPNITVSKPTPEKLRNATPAPDAEHRAPNVTVLKPTPEKFQNSPRANPTQPAGTAHPSVPSVLSVLFPASSPRAASPAQKLQNPPGAETDAEAAARERDEQFLRDLEEANAEFLAICP